MELIRPAAASTFVTFPMADSTGFALSGLGTLTGTWVAWGDTAGPKAAGNPGFRTLSGGFTEIAATAVYTGALASTELPAASPYVMLRFTGGTAATQYLLVKTSSAYANITAIQGTAIATPITAGYMPLDVKQSITLGSPTDNSVEKALARAYMATPYVAVSTTADAIWDELIGDHTTDNTFGKGAQRLYYATPFTALTIGTVNALAANAIDATVIATGAIDADAIAANAIGASELATDAVAEIVDAVWDEVITSGHSTDNTAGLLAARLYHATQYLDAAVSSRLALSSTVTLAGPTDNTVDKALARAYMMATNYVDAAVTSRLAPTVAARTLDVSAAGEAGLDWANVGSPTTTVGLTNTTVGTLNTLAAGSIASTSFSANAIEAAGIAVDVGSEFADAFLGRTIRGSDSTGRRVYEALQFLRNRVNLAAGTLTIYESDDTTSAWTATVATEAVTAIVTDINP